MKKQKSRTSKMFSALVLGGGLLVEPAAANENNMPNNKDLPPLQTENQWFKSDDSYCQLEFTLKKYDREGYEKDVTCLDELSDAEIIKVIKESKADTCQSPFCGCWLG